MIISIGSGKGGTGKTTIATNLALSIDNVSLIDCDVEEPNANIFIKTKIKKSEDVFVSIPKINKNKCDFCEKCSDFCAYNAIAVVPSDVLVFSELCHSCKGCEIVCPMDAVKWEDRSIGKIEFGLVDDLNFCHGLLNVGEVMALPLLKSLKKKVDSSKNVILDAPPGTSCSFIETIRDSDYCILVTEPTPFGFHDLKLAVDVVRHMYIPFGVIINRDDIGDKKVEMYCQQQKIPVLMKISHSEEIAKLYSQGIPLVHKHPEWKIKFQKLFEDINSGVEK